MTFKYIVQRDNGDDILVLEATGIKQLFEGYDDMKERGMKPFDPGNLEHARYYDNLRIFRVTVDTNGCKKSSLPRVSSTYKGKYETLEDIKEETQKKILAEATYYNGLQNPDWDGLAATNVKTASIYKLALDTYGITLTNVGNKSSDKPTIIEEFKSYFKK